MQARTVYRATDQGAWLRLRTAGQGAPLFAVGASDTPAAMGLSTMRGQWDLWTDHHGPAHNPPADDDDIRTRGHLFEPLLTEHYEEATGRPIDTSLLIVADSEHPWRRASTDALVGGHMEWRSLLDAGGGVQVGMWAPAVGARVVECKTFSRHDRAKWARRDILDPVSARDAVRLGLVPEPYVVQCIWQALVCGVGLVDLVAAQCSTSRHRAVNAAGHALGPVWVMEGRPFIVSISVQEHTKRWLADSIAEWRRVHLLGGMQPDPDGSAAQVRAYQERMLPGLVPATDEMRHAAAGLARARAATKASKANEDIAKGRILALLGENTQAVEPDNPKQYVARARTSVKGVLTIDAVDTLD